MASLKTNGIDESFNDDIVVLYDGLATLGHSTCFIKLAFRKFADCIVREAILYYITALLLYY